jgi:hypothetical protein
MPVRITTSRDVTPIYTIGSPKPTIFTRGRTSTVLSFDNGLTLAENKKGEWIVYEAPEYFQNFYLECAKTPLIGEVFKTHELFRLCDHEDIIALLKHTDVLGKSVIEFMEEIDDQELKDWILFNIDLF